MFLLIQNGDRLDVILCSTNLIAAVELWQVIHLSPKLLLERKIHECQDNTAS
jgi:hypothetical protein